MNDGVPPFRLLVGISNERGQWVQLTHHAFDDISGATQLFETMEAHLHSEVRLSHAQEITAVAVAKGLSPSKLSTFIADTTGGRTDDRYALSSDEARLVLEKLTA